MSEVFLFAIYMLQSYQANKTASSHLEFSEGRGPNFRKGANQYKTKKERI